MTQGGAKRYMHSISGTLCSGREELCAICYNFFSIAKYTPASFSKFLKISNVMHGGRWLPVCWFDMFKKSFIYGNA